MVGNGNRRMPPLMGAFNKRLGRGHTIHGGHGGVQMQLYPLFGGVISYRYLFYRIDMSGTQNHIPVIFIVGDISLHQKGIARFDAIQLCFVGDLIKDFEIDRAGVIGDRNGHDKVVVIPGDAGIHRENVAPYHSGTAIHGQSGNRRGSLPDEPGVADRFFAVRVIREIFRFGSLGGAMPGGRFSFFRLCSGSGRSKNGYRRFFPPGRKIGRCGLSAEILPSIRGYRRFPLIFRHRDKADLRAQAEQGFRFGGNFARQHERFQKSSRLFRQPDSKPLRLVANPRLLKKTVDRYIFRFQIIKNKPESVLAQKLLRIMNQNCDRPRSKAHRKSALGLGNGGIRDQRPGSHRNLNGVFLRCNLYSGHFTGQQGRMGDSFFYVFGKNVLKPLQSNSPLQLFNFL